MGRKIFSLAVDEVVYFNSTEDKIELVHCPYDKKECVRQLPDINKYFQESHQSRMDKDYQRAIEALKQAFDITYDIQECTCTTCAGLFRTTIISSMKILRSELKDLTSGWFSNKRFVPAFELATNTLKEMNQKMRG